MAADESSGARRIIGSIEHELTLHLERAHDLAERAKRSNDAVQHEIDRARAIAEELRGRMRDADRE
jgi:hypothetical protein